MSLVKFSVGDIISTYHTGFFRVTKIERRFLTAEDKKYYTDAYADLEVDYIVHLQNTVFAGWEHCLREAYSRGRQPRKAQSERSARCPSQSWESVRALYRPEVHSAQR